MLETKTWSHLLKILTFMLSAPAFVSLVNFKESLEILKIVLTMKKTGNMEAGPLDAMYIIVGTMSRLAQEINSF